MSRSRLILLVISVIVIASCGPAADPAVTAPPEPVDAVPWPELVWATADVPVAQEPVTERLAAVAANERGFVAVGVQEIVGRRDGVIVFSPDGKSWERAGAAAVLSEVDLMDVVSGPGGFVAVGSTLVEGAPPVTVMLRSLDGRSWERIVPPRATDTYAYAAGGGPHGYLVAGSVGDNEPATWLSADGASWRRVPTDALDPGTGGLIDPRSEGDGWIALGSIGDAPAFLRSADGINWTATAIGPTDDAYADRLVAGRWGYVVQGGKNSCGFFSCGEPMTWWSGDGRTWGRLPAGNASEGGVLALAEAGDRGVIAVNREAAWSSTTGWTWTALPKPDASADDGLNAVVVRGDIVVAVGERYLADDRSVIRILIAE